MARDVVTESKFQQIRPIEEKDLDDLFNEAIKVVAQYDRASASLIQRRLCIGYARAARIIDQLEACGAIESSKGGSSSRAVLVTNADDFIKAKPIKHNLYNEPVLKYTKPRSKIIIKPKANPWKKSFYETVNDTSYKKLDDYTFPLGYSGDVLVTKNLTDFTHLSITGNLSSDKEFLLDTIITSLISKLSPDKFRLILVDANRFLSFYEGLPHLLSLLITESDKSISALRWCMAEMERRFKLFTEEKVRDLTGYNKLHNKVTLPEILIVINHFEHVYIYSPVEMADAMVRLTSLGRRAGFHFIITTDRLTRTEVPVVLQSNIPNKIFFRLTSRYDSGSTKINGAEDLKNGEAIIVSDLERTPTNFDTIYTSEDNVKDVVKEITSQK